jgi:hypothetical protein
LFPRRNEGQEFTPFGRWERCQSSSRIQDRGRHAMKKPYIGINPDAKPTGSGCEECLATDGWWLHLRRCAECGHIGCCDSSPGQHAAKHAAEFGHPIVASFEPLQGWLYDYEKRKVFRGVRLPSPQSHPESQPAPGPPDKVPENWESLLHDAV